MKKNIHVVGAVIIENIKSFVPNEVHQKHYPLNGRKIEAGETPQEALSRETKEEMQSKVEIGDQVEHTVYEYDFGIVDLTNITVS